MTFAQIQEQKADEKRRARNILADLKGMGYETIWEDSLIELVGEENHQLLRKYHLIESCDYDYYTHDRLYAL